MALYPGEEPILITISLVPFAEQVEYENGTVILTLIYECFAKPRKWFCSKKIRRKKKKEEKGRDKKEEKERKQQPLAKDNVCHHFIHCQCYSL